MTTDRITAQRIGLVAGWGRYPIVVAEALKRQQFAIYCLGIKNHADPSLQSICDDFRWIGVAKLGAQLRYFRRHRIRRAVMAGKIFKDKIFHHGWGWIGHLPDWRCLRVLFRHLVTKTKDRRDDTLLGALADAGLEDGIVIAPATDYVPELLVKLGHLTRRRPSGSEQKDIRFAWHMAKELGRLDIGQSVAVKGLSVLAVEAIEGTDKCIRRAGQLCPRGGFTVVKVSKPQQDMRFDVPTIGLGTLETLVESGGRVLAVEAGKTIIIDEPQVIDYADRHGLTIIAMHDAQSQSIPAAA